MSLRQKWRRWCRAIEDNILQQYKHDRLIYEGYIDIVESNQSIQSPADFHDWCCRNYGKNLLLYVRMLSDKDPRTYSIRKLVGNIAENRDHVTKYAFLRCYEARHKKYYLNYWDTNVGSNHQFLPKSIPLGHIKLIESLTEKAVKEVNETIAHFERKRHTRIIKFEEVDRVIFQLVEILFFYSMLIGGKVACDTNNYIITCDWQAVFDWPWRVGGTTGRMQ